MKKLIFITLLSLLAVSGWGQEKNNNERNSSDYYIFDFTASEETCQEELQNVCEDLNAYFNGQVKIILYKSYAPIVYLKDTVAVKVNEEFILAKAQSLGQNYIVFHMFVSKSNGTAKVKAHFKIADNVFQSTSCSSKKVFLFANIQQTLDDSKLNSLTNSDCAVKDALKYLHTSLDENCNLNLEEKRNWWLSNDFESIAMPGVDIVISPDSLSNNKKTSDLRSELCTYVDYTFGELKLKTGNTNLTSIYAILSEIKSDFDTLRIIISDYRLKDSLAIDYFNHEKNNPSCQGLIWIHFPGTFVNGEDEVMIRVARNNAPEYDEFNYSYEELQEKYSIDTDFFADFFKIDFRLQNHKEEVLALINMMKTGNQFEDFAVFSDLEYLAGLVSGFGDGMIEAIDLLSLVAQASEKFNAQSNPLSSSWWATLFIHYQKKNNFYEAFREKWGETYESWKSLANNSQKLFNYLSNNYLRGELMASFSKAVLEGATKWGKDMVFLNGNYDAGYAHGKVLFELIPISFAFNATTKGAMFITHNSKNIALEIGENIGKNLDDAARKKLMKDAQIAVDKSALLTKLTNLKNLEAWLKNGKMPDWAQGELYKWSDAPSMQNYLQKLNGDIGSNSKWKKYMEDNGKSSMDAWRYLAKKYPDKNHWCIP